MNFKLHIRFFFTWMFSVYLLAAFAVSEAAELGLVSQPLFLASGVDPNIFFMLDDSSSMDMEIFMNKHMRWNDYWGGGGGRQGIGANGSFYVKDYGQESRCRGRTINLNYFFDTDDNKWELRCRRGVFEHGDDDNNRNGVFGDVDWRIRSADVNVIYYDPSRQYRPWEGFSDAVFSNARSNPQAGTDGYALTRDLGLADFKYEVWIDNLGRDNVVNGPSTVQDGANGEVDLWDSHTTYTVNSTSTIQIEHWRTTFASVDGNRRCNSGDVDSNYSGCFGTTLTPESLGGTSIDPWGRTVSEVKQNIANWYQYHRRRSFVAKSAISKVIRSNTSFRFGLTLLNGGARLFVEVPAGPVRDYIPHNSALLEDLFEHEWINRGTPLRKGLETAGRYYSNLLEGRDPIIAACQQNYTVLFTDGFWSSRVRTENRLDTPAIRNVDQDGDGSKYSVADVAKYFYDIDLSSTLANDVPTSATNQNNRQHMVTFTVAFGLEGNLKDQDNNRIPDTDYTGVADTEVTESSGWHRRGLPDSSNFSNAEKIDDLWHAAFNSKGYFVSAQSTDAVSRAISDAILEIADRVGSAASVATNSGSLNAGSKLFQARFDSADWKGQLLAFQINLDGSVGSSPAWEAGSLLNATNYDTGREIITFNPDAGGLEGAGVPFRFPANYKVSDPLLEMSSDQVSHLLTNSPHDAGTTFLAGIAENQTFGNDIVNYLRGDGSNEDLGQGFRVRSSILGDIVNSAPTFVDVPNGRYPDDLESEEASKRYSTFVTANAARQGVVYVGANDGMLHGFNDDTGAEVIAYVPTAVYGRLDDLASTSYSHSYFVDAGPNIADVFLDGANDPASSANGLWRTVLVGGLNGGGQQIYALDVTDPGSFDEANAADIVLWEFDDSDDADLGYTYGRPQIAKMKNGKWVAIFGNGYNSTEIDGHRGTGDGVLFIVDVETGETLKRIDTNSGTVNTPNGLATPLLIDHDGDSIVDYIYAGDLLGNLWKFDVTRPNPNEWKVAGGGATPRPLFTTNSGQPITSQPQATMHPDFPNRGGFMIFVGSGKYLEMIDNVGAGQTTQSFYGIWDKNEQSFTTMTSSSLLSQSITNQFTQSFDTDNNGSNDEDFMLRDVSNNLINWDDHDGWVLDLKPVKIDNVANRLNFGERQVSNATVRNGRVLFSTLTPSAGECDFGGSSFLMQVDFRDGSALEFPAFDFNGDGEFDTDDTNASGRASNVGVMPRVSILGDGPQDIAFGVGVSGDIETFKLNVGSQAYGRQSWRQLE